MKLSVHGSLNFYAPFPIALWNSPAICRPCSNVECGFALHSCNNAHTSIPRAGSSALNQSARIPRKDEVNECSFYSMRVMIEKETSTPSALRPTDARQAFENLFKKK
jgi:hypothetical protein